MAVIVLAIAAVVMVPCMIRAAGIVLYLLSSSPSRDPNVVMRKKTTPDLLGMIPRFSLFVNPNRVVKMVSLDGWNLGPSCLPAFSKARKEVTMFSFFSNGDARCQNPRSTSVPSMCHSPAVQFPCLL